LGNWENTYNKKIKQKCYLKNTRICGKNAAIWGIEISFFGTHLFLCGIDTFLCGIEMLIQLSEYERIKKIGCIQISVLMWFLGILMWN